MKKRGRLFWEEDVYLVYIYWKHGIPGFDVWKYRKELNEFVLVSPQNPEHPKTIFRAVEDVLTPCEY